MSFFKRLEIGDRAFGYIVILSFLAFLAHKPLTSLFDKAVNAQPWFHVKVRVLPMAPGEDGMVEITRTVKQHVRGVWTARITKGGSARTFVCSNSGYRYFDPESSGTVIQPLVTFIGEGCHLERGAYDFCMMYELSGPAEIKRVFGPYCSRFHVAG